MHLALVHDHVTDTPDAKDVLSQAALVEDAFFALGHTSVRIPCTLNLLELRERIGNTGADLVFNLVESLDGKGSLIHLFPFLLDAMNVPYTGASAEALLLTSNKVLAKQKLKQAGIPTAPYTTVGATSPSPAGETLWIIKSVWEHASIGLSGESILPGIEIAARLSPLGEKYFAEQFIDGREFNVSLLGGPDGPQVLSPAEIIFDGYPPGKAKIVDYKAKWEEDTFEYRHTLRSFDFPPTDAPLLERLTAISLSCWNLFGLRGWARVDFRVDAEGTPYVLEVNANPCLSPDAGFAAALAQAGISPTEAIARIIGDTSQPSACRAKGVRRGQLAVDSKELCFREEVTEADREEVRKLVSDTGFFHEDEVNVAVELVEERLLKGNESGYHFILADRNGQLAGYACFGPVPCTKSSFDLYWVAVSPELQGNGLGRQLMAESEKRIKALGGTQVYVDTSSRTQYAATRAFYERCGYSLEVILADFYAEGDGKALYCKVLS